MAILDSMGGICSIFIMIAMGSLISRKEILKKSDLEFISRLVVEVSIPCLVFNSMFKTLREGYDLSDFCYILVPVLLIPIMYIVVFFIGSKNKTKERRGLLASSFVFSNTIFIGLPLCVSLYGEKIVPACIIYYLASTNLFWSIGVNVMRGSLFSGEFDLKSLWNNPMKGVVAGVIMGLVGLDIPSWILNPIASVGGLSTPLSLFVIGHSIEQNIKGTFKLDMEMNFSIIGKLFISPLMFFFILKLIGAPLMILKGFVLQSAMPTLAQLAVVSARYDIEPELSNRLVFLTTIFSMISIPIWVLMI